MFPRFYETHQLLRFARGSVHQLSPSRGMKSTTFVVDKKPLAGEPTIGLSRVDKMPTTHRRFESFGLNYTRKNRHEASIHRLSQLIKAYVLGNFNFYTYWFIYISIFTCWLYKNILFQLSIYKFSIYKFFNLKMSSLYLSHVYDENIFAFCHMYDNLVCYSS